MDNGTAVRMGGAALALGSIAWATTLLVTGPAVDGVSPRLEILGGLAYQLGLAGLLLAVWRTRGFDHVRGARSVLVTEAVLLSLATIWSVVYAIDHRTQEHLAMVVLDATWPLSILGLIAIGIYLMIARVWPSPVRQLALVATLWMPLDVAAMLIGGDAAGLAFRITWLIVVWGGLGVLIAVHGTRLQQHPAERDAGAPRVGLARS